MTSPLPVLVTAMGGGGHGEQILKALKLAESDRYRLIGADANPKCPQFQDVDSHGVLPLASDPDYMHALFALCDLHGIKALFHGCEPELKLFSKHRAEIERRGIFLPINPDSVIDIGMDKEKTFAFLAEHGFDVPRYLRVTNRDELRQVDWFPLVAKPSVGGGGSSDVFIVQSQKELLALADYLGLERISGSFVLQEYVGTPEQEFTVGVLHDMDGAYINSIAVRRMLLGQLNIRSRVANRTGREEMGKQLVISSGVSQGEVGRFPEVTEPCRKIAELLGVQGAINVQCRLVNGKIMVFEINPRFSGTTSLRAMVGYNEPDLLIRRHLMGENLETDFAYEEATILRSLTETKV